jgi:hypothetical protein
MDSQIPSEVQAKSVGEIVFNWNHELQKRTVRRRLIFYFRLVKFQIGLSECFRVKNRYLRGVG